MQRSWTQWILGIVSVLIGAGIAATIVEQRSTAAQLASIQSTLTALHARVSSLEQGISTPMAPETRARFVDFEDRIEDLRIDVRELARLVHELRASMPAKKSGAQSERAPLPAFTAQPPDIGG